MSQCRRWMWVACLSFSGVVIAHLGAYFVVEPDGHHRVDLLQATGHGRWDLVVSSAAAFLVAACLAALVCGRQGSRRPTTLRSLALLQIVMFLGLETIERAVQGVDLLHALAQPIVIVGVALQVATAWAISTLLRAAAALGDILRAALEPGCRRVALALHDLPAAPLLRDPQGSLDARTLRGPPAHLPI